MPRRFVDLSVALEADIQSDPDIMLPQIEYFSHDQTAGQVAGFFEGLSHDELPGGEGWAIERLQIATHNGTHLDAPYHHHSTMNNGERAITIDEVPLEWCFGNGVKLDFRHFDDGYIVQPDDVEAELKRIGHNLEPLDIVLVNTSAGARYGHPDYLGRGCGMGRDATMYLLERGVRLTGTDAWSWDAPFNITAERYARDKDASIIWEGHRASMEIGYCHIEKLAQLDQLPGDGFLVSCFPFKIKAASAGFTRAVAIFEE
ncbi:cyclase family protein [uncultured Sulfitobacter sp.]|uniref:cyclase family protein n=1 Tax=uncultured Sulfitobacter sp. TaxID=191468 RepID=UPI0026257FFD|nr:cyclase family protein [uncultured Sulfitobacter sp.]